MKWVRSEDAVRRAFLKGEAETYAQWLYTHLERTYEELLSEPWIMDMDGTVKPLYGRQEQAVRGYNPTKHGRPSPVYQTYFMAAIRVVLDVEGAAGQSDCFPVRSAGTVGLAGPADEGAMAEAGAGRHQLGYGSGDGGK